MNWKNRLTNPKVMLPILNSLFSLKLSESKCILAQEEKLFGMVDELEAQTTRSRTDAAALAAAFASA